MSFEEKDMLRKAKKHNYPTIRSRWKAQQSRRSWLEKHDIDEKGFIFYDQIVLEKHD